MTQFKTKKFDITQTSVFFTSDTHFMHANIVEYCNRPFNTVDEMDEEIIKRWNKMVGEDDVVFHLGDFCFGSEKSWRYLISRLNGMIYLVAGNHDKNITMDHFVDVDQIMNIMVQGDDEMDDDQRITLCHYPMISWYQSHRGAWQFFGHVHGGLIDDGFSYAPKLTPNQLDVGVDVHQFAPVSYQQAKKIITKNNSLYA